MPIGPEHRLTTPAELLFRQASPGWMREGRPSAQLFRPRPKDQGKVSVDRDSVIKTAQASRDLAIKNRFPSAGTWAVSVAEVNGETLDVFADPSQRNSAHALIDMTALSTGQQANAADRLHSVALGRGRQA